MVAIGGCGDAPNQDHGAECVQRTGWVERATGTGAVGYSGRGQGLALAAGSRDASVLSWLLFAPCARTARCGPSSNHVRYQARATSSSVKQHRAASTFCSSRALLASRFQCLAGELLAAERERKGCMRTLVQAPGAYPGPAEPGPSLHHRPMPARPALSQLAPRRSPIIGDGYAGVVGRSWTGVGVGASRDECLVGFVEIGSWRLNQLTSERVDEGDEGPVLFL